MMPLLKKKTSFSERVVEQKKKFFLPLFIFSFYFSSVSFFVCCEMLAFPPFFL